MHGQATARFDAGGRLRDSPAMLVHVLRTTAALRLGLVVLALLVYAPLLPGGLVLLLGLATVERMALLGLVGAARFRRLAGPVIIPLALAWLLLMPLVEGMVTLVFAARGVPLLGASLNAVDITNPMIWLVVPVSLASWRYGRRGLLAALAVIVSGHAFMAVLAWTNWQGFSVFALSSAERLAMLAVLGYVVLHLAEAKAAEQAALEQANRRLAQRAATVEQLAESRERNRLARDLHDTLAHSLSGLSVQLQAMSALLDGDPALLRAQVQQAQATVRNGAAEARRAIQALRASPLEDLGLAQALRRLCEAQAERTGIVCACTIAETPALDPLTEQAIYRIAVEALANVEKHAAATSVRVRLEPATGGRLRLVVADDGVGFAPDRIPPDRFGLTGMAERAALVGADLVVNSQPGRGATVELLTAGDGREEREEA